LLLAVAVGACTEPNPLYSRAGDARTQGDSHGGGADAGSGGAAGPPTDTAPPPSDLAPAADRPDGAPDARTPDAAVDRQPDGTPPPADAASLQSGLAQRWGFDEGTGNTSADSSGSGNTATLQTGASWSRAVDPRVPLPNNACIALDGTRGYVDFTTSMIPSIESPKAVSLWLFFLSGAVGQRTVLALYNDTASVGLQIGTVNDRPAMWQWGMNAGLIVSDQDLPNRTWHHIAYVFDGMHHLYVDGVKKGSSPQMPPQTGKITSVRMGTFLPGLEMFKGSVDDLRIYKRMLSPVEVTQLSRGL
jgi:hypothetical protein